MCVDDLNTNLDIVVLDTAGLDIVDSGTVDSGTVDSDIAGSGIVGWGTDLGMAAVESFVVEMVVEGNFVVEMVVVGSCFVGMAVADMLDNRDCGDDVGVMVDTMDNCDSLVADSLDNLVNNWVLWIADKMNFPNFAADWMAGLR